MITIISFFHTRPGSYGLHVHFGAPHWAQKAPILHIPRAVRFYLIYCESLFRKESFYLVLAAYW